MGMITKPDESVQKTRRYQIADEKQSQPIYEMVPYYEEALILGDSLAESILDFRLLRKNNVVAKRGRCIDTIQGDLLFAIAMEPAVIFMEYGKNDILRLQRAPQSFITCYRSQIAFLKKALPDTAIYINSIIPVCSDIMERNGGERLYRLYNEALQRMCEDLQLGFIDNSTLMKWRDELYEYDGIHPKYPYYPLWLRHMARCAGLLKDLIET